MIERRCCEGEREERVGAEVREGEEEKSLNEGIERRKRGEVNDE